MKDIRLIIFDVGGVLRDSSKAINEGFRTGFKKAGINYEFNAIDVWHLRGVGKYNNSENAIKACLFILRIKKDLNKILNSSDAENILDILVQNNIRDTDKNSIKIIREEYKRFFNLPSTKKLIEAHPYTEKSVKMFKKHYKLAIFSNASLISIKRDMKYLGFSNFSVIVSEEHVKNKKPSGEGIKLVCKKMKIEPKNAVYVGDSVDDIKAARDAGCVSIAVTCGMGLEKFLTKEKPDYIFRNIYEMTKFLCD